MKLLKWLDEHLEEALVALLLCVVSCLMMTQIILRAFGSALSFSDEACRYMYIWMAALGIPYATKRESHLRMDILPTIIKPLRKPLEVMCDLVLLCVAIYFLAPGYHVLQTLARTGQQAATTKIPMYFVYASFWIGMILTIFRIAEKYIRLLFAGKKHTEEG